MYDKTSRPPPAGSLREAVLLTVWLRRQDQEVYKLRAILSAGGEGAQKTFLEYYDKVFPFAAHVRGDTDKKMIDTMKKEVAKGPITFKPVSTDSPLNKAVQRLRLPDDFKEKLRNRRK